MVLSGMNIGALLGTFFAKPHEIFHSRGGEEYFDLLIQVLIGISLQWKSKFTPIFNEDLVTSVEGEPCLPFLYRGIWRGYGSCTDIPWADYRDHDLGTAVRSKLIMLLETLTKLNSVLLVSMKIYSLYYPSSVFGYISSQENEER